MSAALGAWWNARAPRERWLALGALLVALGANSRISIAAATQQANDNGRMLQARTQALRARRERAEAAISAAHVDLIDPQEMGRQLAAILARHPQLHVVGIQSGPPLPLVAGDGAKGGAPGGGAAGLYEHELELQVAGSYLDLIAYLRALEQAPHRIYWRELDLKVDDQGVPVTRLTLFTLSKDTRWLKL